MSPPLYIKSIYKEHTEVKKKRILRYSFNHYLKIELTFIYF